MEHLGDFILRFGSILFREALKKVKKTSGLVSFLKSGGGNYIEFDSPANSIVLFCLYDNMGRIPYTGG